MCRYPYQTWNLSRKKREPTKFASTDAYPNPFTTRGKKTENAWPGTLAQILHTSANHIFQSLAVSTTSLLNSRSDTFSNPSSLYRWCWTYLALSSCILITAKLRCGGLRNQAVPGSAGSQNQAIMPKMRCLRSRRGIANCGGEGSGCGRCRMLRHRRKHPRRRNSRRTAQCGLPGRSGYRM